MMGRLAKVAYGVAFACSVVSWIVLLSGNGGTRWWMCCAVPVLHAVLSAGADSLCCSAQGR